MLTMLANGPKSRFSQLLRLRPLTAQTRRSFGLAFPFAGRILRPGVSYTLSRRPR